MRGPPALNPPAQPRRPRQGYGRRRGNGGAGPGWCRTLRVSDDDAYISLTIFLVYAHLNSQVYYFVNRDSVRLNSSLALSLFFFYDIRNGFISL